MSRPIVAIDRANFGSLASISKMEGGESQLWAGESQQWGASPTEEEPDASPPDAPVEPDSDVSEPDPSPPEAPAAPVEPADASPPRDDPPEEIVWTVKALGIVQDKVLKAGAITASSSASTALTGWSFT
jgi:hypothetical protein